MRWRDLQPRTIHFSERIPLRMLFRSPTSEEPRVNRFLKMGELLDFEFKAEQLLDTNVSIHGSPRGVSVRVHGPSWIYLPRNSIQ
jgi:hypothetical protein